MAIIIDYTSGATTPNPMELGEIIRRAGLTQAEYDLYMDFVYQYGSGA